MGKTEDLQRRGCGQCHDGCLPKDGALGEAQLETCGLLDKTGITYFWTFEAVRKPTVSFSQKTHFDVYNPFYSDIVGTAGGLDTQTTIGRRFIRYRCCLDSVTLGVRVCVATISHQHLRQ